MLKNNQKKPEVEKSSKKSQNCEKPKVLTIINKVINGFKVLFGLRTIYNEIDLSDFTKEKLEYQKKLYEEEKKKYTGKKRYFLSTLSLDNKLIEILDNTRRNLLFQWRTKMIPTGGNYKSDSEIISDFKKLRKRDVSDVHRMGNDSEWNLLVDFVNLDAGLNQYFPEMISTETVNGSVIDCLLENNRDRFLYGYESKIFNHPKIEITGDNFFRIFKQMCRISTATQPVGNFPCLVATYIILQSYYHTLEVYNKVPNDNFVILDPCSGWAGRFLGTLCAFHRLREDYKDRYGRELHVTYLTTDPNVFIHSRFQNIKLDWFEHIEPEDTSRFFHLEKAVLGCETPDFLTFCKDTLETLGLSGVNVALTSPPYFNREKYQGEFQSHKMYLTYPEWSDGFLKEMINNVHELLLPGARFYLNIANTVDKDGSVNPLESDSCRFFQDTGMKEVAKYKMLLPVTTISQNMVMLGIVPHKFEPVFVYEKVIK